MSKRLNINGSIWIAVWTLAILVAVLGGGSPAESWRFDIQLPGIGLTLLLMAVTGPSALIFGASGRVFLVAVTILTNGFVYTAFDLYCANINRSPIEMRIAFRYTLIPALCKKAGIPHCWRYSAPSDS